MLVEESTTRSIVCTLLCVGVRFSPFTVECTYCRKKLKGQPFKLDKKGKPYCQPCMAALIFVG